MIRKLALLALVLLLAIPPATAVCAGTCYDLGYRVNLGDHVILDTGGLPIIYNAYNESGLSISQTVGVTSKETANAYCAAKVGAGSGEIWGAPYSMYSTDFSNTPPISLSSVINNMAGWTQAINHGNQSGEWIIIRCGAPTGGETILGVTPSNHLLMVTPYYSSIFKLYYPPAIIADFNATPSQGFAPLSAQFYDNSTGDPSSWVWSISPTAGWSTGYNALTSQNPSVYFTANGNYTITLNASNQYSSDIETKTDYIWVYNDSSTATTNAVARDLYTGYAINGAQVDMFDVENASWTNTTAPNGIGSITTLLGHTLNIYGSASGYDEDNLMGVPAVNGGYYSLLLRPTNITTFNSTAGNLTLFVTVQDLQLPHPTISGAEVTAAWGAEYASGVTNAAGSASFTVPNNTAIYLSAFKSGYASGSKTHITGSANGGSTMETAVMYIGTDHVTPTVTATLTTGPGGTVPPTVDPYPCIGDGSATDTANCQRKQGSMAAGLISWGPDLMNFFIMLTIVGGLLLLVPKR